MHPRTLIAPLTLFGLVLLAVLLSPQREHARARGLQVDYRTLPPPAPDHPLDRIAYPDLPSQRLYDKAVAEGARDAQRVLGRGRFALDATWPRGVRVWVKTHYGLSLDEAANPYRGHMSPVESGWGYRFGYNAVMAKAIDARHGSGATRRALTEGERLDRHLFRPLFQNSDSDLETKRAMSLLPVEVTSFAIRYRLHADRAGVVDSVEIFASYKGDGGCKRGPGSAREKEGCPPSQPLAGPYPRFEEAYVQAMKRERFGAVDVAYDLRDVNPRVVDITTWSW